MLAPKKRLGVTGWWFALRGIEYISKRRIFILLLLTILKSILERELRIICLFKMILSGRLGGRGRGICCIRKVL
jgi:hypothetical protein